MWGVHGQDVSRLATANYYEFYPMEQHGTRGALSPIDTPPLNATPPDIYLAMQRGELPLEAATLDGTPPLGRLRGHENHTGAMAPPFELDEETLGERSSVLQGIRPPPSEFGPDALSASIPRFLLTCQF